MMTAFSIGMVLSFMFAAIIADRPRRSLIQVNFRPNTGKIVYGRHGDMRPMFEVPETEGGLLHWGLTAMPRTTIERVESKEQSQREAASGAKPSIRGR
jgi:hypothetical protein